jgi:hypothetical protein
MLRIAAVLALVATGLAASPALARQTGFEQSVAELKYEGSKPPLTAQERLQALETQIAAIQATLNAKEAAVNAGQAPLSELAPLKAQLGEGLIALSAAKKAADRERITTVLYRPVDLELRDATLQQTTQALARATGLAINVDNGVTSDARLTLQARGVPLAAVLDSVSCSLGIMISPAVDGVVLKLWPVLEVNGEKRVFIGPDGAWGADWGYDAPRLHRFLKSVAAPQPGGLQPSMNPFVALPAVAGNDLVPTGPGGGGPEPILPDPQPVAGAPQPLMGELPFAAWPNPPAVAVAAIGPNLVVVAEPGQSPQGETGFWLTLYRLESNRLKKVSTLFHTSPGPRQPTLPPSPGLGQPVVPPSDLLPQPGTLPPSAVTPPVLPTSPGDLPTAPIPPGPATAPADAAGPAAGPDTGRAL